SFPGEVNTRRDVGASADRARALLLRNVRKDDRAVAQLADVGEGQLERRRLDALEDSLTNADDDGHDPDAEFVDELRAEEHAVEASGAVLDEVLARLGLEVLDRCDNVGAEEGGIPRHAVERPGGDVFGHRADAVDVGVTAGAPVLAEPFIADAA